MKKTKEEILDSLRLLLGDNTSDDALALIEDVTDSMETTGVDWEAKYKENDANWRKRYHDRFFNTPVDDPDPVPEPEEKPALVKTNFEDLFTKED